MSSASALGLSPSEEAATAQFMSLVNEWRSVRGFEPVSSAAAVKFLMARKFRHVFAFVVQFVINHINVEIGANHPFAIPANLNLATTQSNILKFDLNSVSNFSVDRALALYQQHELMRAREEHAVNGAFGVDDHKRNEVQTPANRS